MVNKCPDVGLRRPESFNHGRALVLLTLILLTGCQQLPSGAKKKPPSTTQKPTATEPAEDGFVHQLAQVESVAAQVSPLDATKADIVISGLLHDGATQIEDIQQQKLADGFVITVTTVRPKNATASLALIPFDRTIDANISAMPKGMCKVMVNGVATTFMIP